MASHRLPAFASALALVLACCLPGAAAADPVHVGAAVDVADVTAIADILASPADHVGKLVRVEGEVHGVCTRMGCWMDLADDDGRRLRVKVEDGALVFPADAVGKPAVAQGTVTVEELPRAAYVSWQKHLAEEGGQPFDESALGDGPFEVVQIAGTGADIGE